MFFMAKDRWVQILSLRAASSVSELHTNHEPVQNGGAVHGKRGAAIHGA
jgi:hypothetical protein